jgi:nucleoside-diphosphate-sugar epimerase
MLQNIESADKASFSDSLVYNIMNSATSESGTVPNTMFPGCCSLKDIADLHVAALTNPKAANKRFVIGTPVKFDTVADSLRKVPGLEVRIGKNNEEDIVLPRIDTSDAEEVFGIKWRSLDDTMRDTAESFLKLEAKSKA